jgi:hypothetical protein
MDRSWPLRRGSPFTELVRRAPRPADFAGGLPLARRGRPFDARHIAVILLPKWRKIPGLLEARDSDGHHFTAKGHAIIASYLLPQVMELLGGK